LREEEEGREGGREGGKEGCRSVAEERGDVGQGPMHVAPRGPPCRGRQEGGVEGRAAAEAAHQSGSGEQVEACKTAGYGVKDRLNEVKCINDKDRRDEASKVRFERKE